MKVLVIKKKEVGKVEEISEDRLVDVRLDEEGAFRVGGENRSVEQRRTGDFTGKAIYLAGGYDWTLGRDREGSICLVPLKRKLGDE